MITNWLKKFDGLTEKLTRNDARTTSRRAFLSGLGTALVGVGAVTLLPVFRGSAFATPSKSEEGNPNSCDYWRYCAIDGFLCSCCGGTTSSCPPGTVPSSITWVGTCKNPTDGKHYIISYNDCCGGETCGRCLCQRGENNTPVYRPQTSNLVNWCAGSEANVAYTCSLSVVVGVSDQ